MQTNEDCPANSQLHEVRVCSAPGTDTNKRGQIQMGTAKAPSMPAIVHGAGLNPLQRSETRTHHPLDQFLASCFPTSSIPPSAHDDERRPSLQRGPGAPAYGQFPDSSSRGLRQASFSPPAASSSHHAAFWAAAPRACGPDQHVVLLEDRQACASQVDDIACPA